MNRGVIFKGEEMLKKFTDGLIFGAGFAIALIIIWSIGIAVVIPKAIDSFNTSIAKSPKFENPKQAEILEPDPSISAKKDFSFFKHSEERMQIPKDGGILAMSLMQTPPNSKRPNTYQLWLTEVSLWQIRTIEDKVEIEKLERPQTANAVTLDNLMYEKLGTFALQSTMTVSGHEIQSLKSSGDTMRDSTLNGKLSLSKEGVVFVYPNNY
jgi:hypothetical protein